MKYVYLYWLLKVVSLWNNKPKFIGDEPECSKEEQVSLTFHISPNLSSLPLFFCTDPVATDRWKLNSVEPWKEE